MSDTVIKKINNTIIFYERDNEKDIEQLFIDGFFDSDERENIKLINNEHWIKKHYFRKGLMKFFGDNYLFAKLQNTRSFQEYSILKYLVKKNFNTCKPIIGWVSSNMISYKANLVVEKIEETKTLSATLISIYRGGRDSSTISSGYYLLGKEVAKMHHHGVFHGDLNANNILVTREIFNSKDKDSKGIYIIDFDKSKIQKISKKDISSNINRLKRSLNKIGIYNENDFQSFETGYKSISNDRI
tara:strand:- start:58 stop:786 length:729 start_codon:yes stop_codon:yes gene_type:complete